MPRECWARKISACDGVITGEHPVSKSLFPSGKVIVKGIPGFKKEKEVGINSLVSNILCKKHNEALSDLDNSAAGFMKNILLFHKYREARLKETYRGRKNIVCDVRLFDRWILKVLCNLSIITKCWEPPESLKKIIYGETVLPDNVGAGAWVRVGDNLYDSQGVEFTFIHKDKNVEGCQIVFFGIPFVCSWRLPLPNLVGLDGEGTSLVKGYMFHTKTIQLGDLNIALSLNW